MTNLFGCVDDTYYGQFRTRTFAEIFPDYATFASMGINGEQTSVVNNQMWYIMNISLTNDNKRMLYYMLYSRFGNSHIANSDENQFRFGLFSTIFQYGPTWEKRLDIQKKLRSLSDTELTLGGEATYNHAYNPEVSPGTSSRDGINFINDQNKTLYSKSKMEGYASLLALLEDDVTETFLSKFKKLFISITAGDEPLVYITEGDE